MKTSNKLLAGGALFLILGLVTFLMSLRNAMEKPEGSYINGDGDIQERYLGELKSNNLNLSRYTYRLDPHSTGITIKGDANIISALDTTLWKDDFDVFDVLRFKSSPDDTIPQRFHFEPTQEIEFTIGVKNYDYISAVTERSAVVTSRDTLTQEIMLYVEGVDDKVELYLDTESTIVVLKSHNTSTNLLGLSKELFVTQNRGSHLKASELIVDHATVDLDYGANLDLNATQDVRGKIRESANIKNVGSGEISVIKTR